MNNHTDDPRAYLGDMAIEVRSARTKGNCAKQ
jgi:hypothetical protein